jgi:peptidoglycan hydrolase-like protein with peptidoglycan-binding domain
MLKKVLFTSICFALISGCALMDSSDVDTEKQDAPASASNPQPGTATSQPVVAAPVAETQSATNQNKNLSSEYIKKIQSHLKETGFYSGDVNGVADAGTQSAIRHFQTGCATLKDLITTSAPAPTQQRLGTAAKAAHAKTKRGATDAVRVVQLRLKDVGFDPGPIDGIHGAKTQAALAALNSGCAMLRDFSAAPENTAGASGERSAAVITETPEDQSGEPSNREAVRLLQARLRDAGFDPGPVDGVVGPRTRSALQKYQASPAKVSALP